MAALATNYFVIFEMKDGFSRNRANPCVRDMPKFIRTSQISAHGYPADMSIFLLQLEIRLTEVTKRQLAVWHVPCRHIWRRCVSCWRAAGSSWSHSPLRVCRFWVIIHVFVSVGTPGVKSADVARLRFCRSSNRLLDSLLAMFLRARRWLVGACAFIQPARTQS